jgi:nitronate monooxygenase
VQKNGKFQNGFAFAGKNAYRAKEIVSVENLVQTLISEYDAATLN